MPKVAVKPECPPHYWKIGQWTDHGVCEICGEERQFTPRGQIDWDQVRRDAVVQGKPARVILPFIASEV